MTRVLFRWERRPAGPVAERLRRTVRDCLDNMNIGPAEVHVLITGDERIRELNRDYRGKDRATDVLSFADGDELPTGRRLLGEIVISLDTARRQAEEAGHTEAQELSELVLHGVLHLLGYDHSSDQGDMNRIELRLRKELLS